MGKNAVYLNSQRSSYWRCSIKKVVFKILQYSQENVSSGLGPATLSKRDFNTVAFLWIQYCKIFKNTYFEQHLRTTASE